MTSNELRKDRSFRLTGPSSGEWWPVDSPHKGPVLMRKAFPYHNIFIISGVCFGCLYGVGNIILSKHFADHPRKGLANGIACAGTGVGSLTLPLLMRYIISTYGLRGALQVYGGCMLQMCVATAVCRPVEKKKTEISQRSTTGNGKVGYKTELRHGSFLESILASFPCCNSKLQDVEPLFQFHLLKKYDLMIILIGHSLIYASYVCCYLYLPPYAAQIGVRKTDTSLILTIGGVCELFARVTTGWVADLQVVKARNIIALSMIVGGMAAIVMPFFTTRELLIAFMIVEGLAGACMGVAIVLAVVESVDQNELTHAFVLLTVSVPVSMASLPPLIGESIFIDENMMTSSNENIFRVTGHLCGEFTGPRWIPRTKASDAELCCFLWSASK